VSWWLVKTSIDDLDYMHACHCSPLTGRFLGTDFVQGNSKLPQSWNRYAYALGNPVRLVDPKGLEPLDYSVAIFMGGFFGMDLTGVQVHGGWFARSVTRALQAEVFTAGTHIFFSKEGWSAYRSIHNTADTSKAVAGISLTAHELTHTAQSRKYGLTVLAVRYLYYLTQVGYWNNPFEAAARATEDTVRLMLRGDPDLLASIQSGPATQPSPVSIGQTPGICCWTVVTSIFDGPLGGLFGLFEFGGELWIDGINLTGVLTTSRPRG
jgi:RHS repeat-associated protein